MKLFGRKKARKADLQFAPGTQYAVIRSQSAPEKKSQASKTKQMAISPK